MAPQFDAIQDLTLIRASLIKYRQLFEDLGANLHKTAPDVSGWCIAQHMYHVVLATDLGLANVLALVREKGMLIKPEGRLTEYAEGVLTAPQSPRGEVQAPRMVQPGNSVDGDQIKTEFDNLERSLTVLENPPRPLEGCPGWIKHQILDTLNASHWMRFCRLHANHHLAIMEDVAKAL
ncbi:MAG: hypothetical protein GY930_06960 [bacterium]|nr:hypothetical protein [bacterium]